MQYTRAQLLSMSPVCLADMIEERDEAIVQLEEAMAPLMALPRAWGLTANQTILFNTILAAAPGICTKERAFLGLYGSLTDNAPQIKILDVMISRIRISLRRAGVGEPIQCVWGRGYFVSAFDADRLRTAIRAYNDTESNPFVVTLSRANADRRAA